MSNTQAFAAAVKIVLVDEGRMNNHPTTDPNGGLTKFGIAQKQHPSVDVANLTQEQAIAIYQSEYWTPCACDRLPWPLSFLVFDSAVNQGVGRARLLLQEALGVRQDGDIGPVTLAAVAKRDPWELTARFTAVRLLWYVKTANFAADGEGWFYRVATNLLQAGRQPQ